MEIGELTKAKKIRDIVKDEMVCIPRGSEPQNMLRSAYAALRMHSLGKKAKREMSETEVRNTAVDLVKKNYPNFIPKFACQVGGKKNDG